MLVVFHEREPGDHKWDPSVAMLENHLRCFSDGNAQVECDCWGSAEGIACGYHGLDVVVGGHVIDGSRPTFDMP